MDPFRGEAPQRVSSLAWPANSDHALSRLARGGHGMVETVHQMNGLPPVTATVVPEV
jgi:hypothetical protein